MTHVPVSSRRPRPVVGEGKESAQQVARRKAATCVSPWWLADVDVVPGCWERGARVSTPDASMTAAWWRDKIASVNISVGQDMGVGIDIHKGAVVGSRRPRSPSMSLSE
jgi:hypothetical protein